MAQQVDSLYPDSGTASRNEKVLLSDKGGKMKVAKLTCIKHPVAICDGDNGGVMEDKFEKLFTENNIQFTREYGLYKRSSDLSKYKTIAFFTTNSRPESVLKIIDFDKSELETVIIIGEWAYEIAGPFCKKLKINLLALDRFNFKLYPAKDFFGY